MVHIIEVPTHRSHPVQLIKSFWGLKLRSGFLKRIVQVTLMCDQDWEPLTEFPTPWSLRSELGMAVSKLPSPGTQWFRNVCMILFSALSYSFHYSHLEDVKCHYLEHYWPKDAVLAGSRFQLGCHYWMELLSIEPSHFSLKQF